jgi:2-methylcitrate dehydratase PrpD
MTTLQDAAQPRAGAGGTEAPTAGRTVSERFASFAVSLSAEKIPAQVREKAKLHLLDAVGCGIAARAAGEQEAAASVALHRAAAGSSVAIGVPQQVDALSASFVNGALIQAMDYDDTHTGSICHVSAVMVPVTLAVAMEAGASGAKALTGLVAGVEVTARLGAVATPAVMRRGMHPTSVFGVFGASACAAAIGELSASEATSALGIVASSSAGVMACLAEGIAVKPLHAAGAARAGALSAELARAGALGPRAVLEGHNGTLFAFDGDRDAEKALRAQVADLGERWETSRLAIKAHPVCHFIHGCLEAATAIDAPVEEIESIEARIDRSGIGIVIEPLGERATPASSYQARFSLPYCVATAIARGGLDLVSIDGAAGDPDVARLAASFGYSPLDDDGSRSQFAGEVLVHLRGGEVRSRRVDHPLGTEGQPMSREDVLEKYRANAALGLSDGAVAEAERIVLDLERQSSLARLGELLAGARANGADGVATAVNGAHGAAASGNGADGDGAQGTRR